MADALVSPAVGGTMLAVSAGAVAYAVKKTGVMDEKKIPVMGVMGAFVFAAQMINFTIPGTGSSGHIGGGILLAAVLGPCPALLTLAAVLLIQCLFFADGGLLAYGCNVFNMGVTACFLAFNLVYRPIAGDGRSKKRIAWAACASVILGLQGGAFSVVLETLASGVTELPFGAFALLMQPIHLAIGLVEGLVTAGVLVYVHGLRPELLESALTNQALRPSLSLRRVLITLAAAAVITGGLLSLFASAFPDGLEWAVEGAAGRAELERPGPVHEAAGRAVEKTALMPDYGFSGDDSGSPLGTAAAGLAGGLITVVIAGGLGFVIRKAARGAHRV
ncbi:MAG: energy-coupling factor ABC transporter permease [Spirochaetaceae bacterium]|nr:energy-coupling factor ABC transporter permease [Spirochaetaceae bacterium]